MSNLERGYIDELNFFIETELNDSTNDSTNDILSNLTEEEKEEIASQLIDDSELSGVLNETIRYYLEILIDKKGGKNYE